jgi:tetratricopeptide (TPR) repeat protein
VARRRKQERDLRLLELELAERPNHPFVLFNLGMTYADMEDAKQAADFLKQCLEVSTPEESHVRKAYALLAACLLQSSDLSDARQVLDQGLALYPDDAELLFRRGVLEQYKGNYQEAIAAYEAAILDRGERRFSSRDRGITGYKARQNIACAYRDLGRLDLAELQHRLALQETPNFAPAWSGLVESLLAQQKFMTLEIEIENASHDGNLRPREIEFSRAKHLAAVGRIQEAVQILDLAITSENGDASEPMQLKCQLLFEHGSPEEAIVALEQHCKLSPSDGAAWHNLGTAHHRAGHAALAVGCYQRSLVERPHSKATRMQLAAAQEELGRPEAAQCSLAVTVD